MQIRFLLLLLLISIVSCSKKRGLRVIAVNKDGMFPDKVQKALELALQWFENAILVEHVTTPFTLKALKHIEGYSSSTLGKVTVQMPNMLYSFDIQSEAFQTIFKSADVAVFIREMASGCGKLPQAYGGVLMSRKNGKFIQKLGYLNYCYNDVKDDFNYFDLFRHEILHTLGYGTLFLHDKELRQKEDTYQWKYEDKTEATATRYFFNTNEKALDEVRKHFGCDKIHGIESDNEGKHLNEYIFQNELMTPILREKNYFSYISAAILENIYGGDKQWYEVNRTFIAPEADAYNYGKEFGCTYLLNSCFDFLEERKNGKDPRPAPFCPDGPMKKCFNRGDSHVYFSCEGMDDGTKADNNIPKPSNSKYSSAYTRYCPILPEYYGLSKFPIVDCPS